MNAVESIDGSWPVPLPAGAADFNQTAIANLRSLMAASSWYNATAEDLPPYGREGLFAQGIGRAVMGYTESMSAMGEAAEQIEFKVMPLGNDPKARPLFYSDVVGVNSNSPNFTLAKQLANLIASEAVNVQAMGTTGPSGNPQYLMPARPSIFAALGKDWPIYDRMYTMVQQADPILFVLEMTERSQLNDVKGAIRDAVQADYPCGCDQSAGPIYNQAAADAACPAACTGFGGWNGQWRTYGSGDSYCGCNACPAAD